jgi:hypothetical protein
VLVTVYNVCNQQNHQAGGQTAHTQQVSLLTRQGRNISPRKDFLNDINIKIVEWLQSGHELVIAGDLNKELGSDIGGFTSISSEHNLAKIIQSIHSKKANHQHTIEDNTNFITYL